MAQSKDVLFSVVFMLVAQVVTATVSGIVLDQTGAAIPAASITVDGQATGPRRTVTAADGSFTVSGLSPGSLVVTASHDGFLPARTTAVVAAGAAAPLRLVLAVAPFEGSVSVSAPLANVSASPTSIDVAPLEVRSVAGAGENIYRVLQTLPGVAAVNDFDSRLSVRGGSPDQNLTVMDGVEVHNPYRLFGLTSAFNPETIDTFELTAGGFGAKYGDRLSSILLIGTREGTRSERFAGSASLTLTDANVVAEGRMPGLDKASFLVSARRTYYDLVADPLVGTNLPGFSDLQAHLTWEPAPGHRVTFSGLGSREHTDAKFDGDQGGEHGAVLADTNNDLAALSWSATKGTRLTNKLTASWYHNRETLDFGGDIRSGALRSNREGDDAVPLSVIAFTRNLSIRDVAVRNELSVQANPQHLIESGFEMHQLATEWTWRISGDRNPGEANGSSVRGGAGLPDLLDSARNNLRGAAWITDRWTIAPRFGFEPGVRLDWSGLSGETVVSPRLALTADVAPGSRVRLSGGLFTQSPGYEKLLQSDYFVDLSNADALHLRSERAWHAVGGWEQTVKPGLVVRAESYYKRFDRLILGRLETPEEVSARVSGYDFPVAFASSVPTDATITGIPGNIGTGRAYGVDFYAAKTALSASTRLTGWVSYTVGKAETTAYGLTYAADYDRLHALSVVANYRWSRLIELATTVRAQSGFPYTPPIGVQVAGVEDLTDHDGDGNVTELVPRFDELGLPIWSVAYGGVDRLNTAHVPVFARADIRLTFRPQWQGGRWQFYIEILNLLNRKNAATLDPELEYDASSDRPKVTMVSGAALPRLPSFGLRFRF
ncbi:MAG: TonB-dependent receptor [Acidobacteriota bacterium]